MWAETGTEEVLDLQENLHLDDACPQRLLLVSHWQAIKSLSLK